MSRDLRVVVAGGQVRGGLVCDLQMCGPCAIHLVWPSRSGEMWERIGLWNSWQCQPEQAGEARQSGHTLAVLLH
eukprot:1277004-Rhodomonas_salina.2